MTLTAAVDRKLARAGSPSTRYVLVTVRAPAAPARDDRLPVNVGLVLDRSGSMNEQRKFPLARKAVERALAMLRSDDRFALVVYDDSVDVLAASTRATADAKRFALERLASIEPRGSTDLCSGWLRGCEQIAARLRDEEVSRCLILTDGLANHGIVDREEIALHAGELRVRGVRTSTFGVGADFDERLLHDMALEGGGNFYFIKEANQITELLTSELGEALEVTIRRASLCVELPEGADAAPLSRFRSERGAGSLRVELGDLVSEQELIAVLKIELPRGTVGDRIAVRIALQGDGDYLAEESSTRIEWTYATHEQNDLQPRNTDVDRAVARLYAARARTEAVEANRAGDFDRSRAILRGVAARILTYGSNDPEMRDVAHALTSEERVYGNPMDAMSLKSAYYGAAMVARARDDVGKARRGS